MSSFAIRNRFAMALAQSIAVMTLCTAGCSGDWLAGLSPTLGPMRLVGTDDNKAFLVARVNEEETTFDNPFPFVPANRDLVSLDLVTRDVTAPASLSSAAARDVLANHDWIVWIDRAAKELNVLDRATNDTATYFNNDDSIDPADKLVSLDGDRLLMYRINLMMADAVAYNCLVFNLRTTDQTIVTDLWFLNKSALKGDWLVIVDDKDVSVEILSLEWAANIDLINLTTSERKRIASNLRISGEHYPFFINDNEIIWQEFKDGGFKEKITLYDIATEKTKTLVDDFDAEGQDEIRPVIVDARDDGLLVTRGNYNAFADIPTEFVIEIWPLDTLEPTEVATYTTTPIFGQTWYLPEPHFVNDFVLWTDPMTGDLVSYEIASGTNQKFEVPLQ